MSSTKNYDQILEEIIKSDGIIRFAAICDKFGQIIEKLQNDEKQPLLDENDTGKLIKAGVDSWYYRKQLSPKIGNGQYSMVVYDKITRLIIPLDDNQFLFVSIDNVYETPKIIDLIKKILSE